MVPKRLCRARRPRPRQSQMPRRDSAGFLCINIPAALASGAHQKGEEAELVVYRVARALDTAGSGRVSKEEVSRELRHAYRGGKLDRVFERAGGKRYWTLDRGFLALRAEGTVFASFDCEVLDSSHVLALSLRWLDSRPRRNAAVLAAMLGNPNPRSNAFVQRFSRVDRKTIYAWRKDEVIRTRILIHWPEWAD